MPFATCPYCEGKITFSDTPQLAQKVSCSHCGEKLEVIGLTPPELDYEYDEENEYEYEDDDNYGY